MTIYEDLKEVISFLQKSDNIGMVSKVYDLQSRMSDLQEENKESKSKIEKLLNSLKIQESLIFENELYWIPIDGEGEKRKGPYCPICWDKEKLVINLVSDRGIFGRIMLKRSVFMCHNCEFFKERRAT